MKYLLMVYGNRELWEGFAPEEMNRMVAGTDAWIRTHAGTGEMLGAYGLGDAVTARKVRVQDGALAVTDGPYLETKEYMSSFYLVDVESEQRAFEIAAGDPFARIGTVEVWPVMHEAPVDL